MVLRPTPPNASELAARRGGIDKRVFLTNKGAQHNKGFFKRLWSRVTIVAGAAIPVEAAQPEALREQVSRLRGGLR